MSARRWMLSVLLVLALLAPGASAPTLAHAGGVVTVCDEAHLLAALSGGGTVAFACSGTITLTAEIVKRHHQRQQRSESVLSILRGCARLDRANRCRWKR